MHFSPCFEGLKLGVLLLVFDYSWRQALSEPGLECPPQTPAGPARPRCPHPDPQGCSGWWWPRFGSGTFQATPRQTPGTAAPGQYTEAEWRKGDSGWGKICQRFWHFSIDFFGLHDFDLQILIRSEALLNLKFRFLFRQLPKIPAESKGTEHGIFCGDGQVSAAGNSSVGVDTRQWELEQIILPPIPALQTDAWDFMRPRNFVTFLIEHCHNVIQILLTGQCQWCHSRRKLGIINGLVKNSHWERAHIHLVSLL